MLDLTSSPYFIILICALLPFLIGGIAILGWYTRIPHLFQLHPNFVPVQFNTAIGFLVCGIGLLLLSHSNTEGVKIVSAFIFIVGGLTLFQYLTRIDCGIDQLFFRHYITVGTSHPGRMAPNTALCFILTATAFLMSTSTQNSPTQTLTAGMLGAIIFAFGTIALLGYLLHLEPAYGWGHLTRMAVPTALGFACVGLGLLIFSSGLWTPPDVNVRSDATIAVIFFGVIMASLLTIAVHYIQRDRQLMQQLQNSHEGLLKEINERKEAEWKAQRSREELQRLNNRLQSVREEEKVHIARELHDELGQTLTVLKMDLIFLEKELQNGQDHCFEKVRAMACLVDETVQSVQRICFQLRPKILDLLGFQEAIEWQTQDFEKHTGIHCTISSGQESISLKQSQTVGLFRVFQETLSNVARHAKATAVEVQLTWDDEFVELMVKDNGIGITPAQIEDSQSLGLIGMRERIHHLGGTMTIRGWMNQGTEILFRIPHGLS